MSNLYEVSYNAINKSSITIEDIRVKLNTNIKVYAIKYGQTLLSRPKEANAPNTSGSTEILPFRLFIPTMANFLANEFGINEIFHATFDIGDIRDKSKFIIIEKEINVRANGSFSDNFSFFRKNIFTAYPELEADKLSFIFAYANGNSSEKEVIELLGEENILPYNSILEKIEKTLICNQATNSPFARNRIIFGAPGTRKSHMANQDANVLLVGKEKELDEPQKQYKAAHMERVTFHPEYSYYDFVGSYKPVMGKPDENGERKIEYRFIPGPFTRILVQALKEIRENGEKAQPCLLIIEEINRARVAAVFGDIFQLLDRDTDGESEYSICLSEDLKEHLKEQGLQLNELKLPSNLYIWATMNSADQGVYPLDTAFKRRWSMEYIPYNPPEGEILHADEWNQIRIGINKLLLEKGHVNEDKLMGYYFLKEEERTGENLGIALKNKVLMYLFDDAAKPCRKHIFLEGKQTFSELSQDVQRYKNNLGVFKADVWTAPSKKTGNGGKELEEDPAKQEDDDTPQ